MEIIHIAANGDYEKYEQLTLQKEELEKEAELYYVAYIREFGEMLTHAFELKVDCISLKKEIALYVAAKNSGRTISAEEVEEYLKTHMSAYKAELERMLNENEEANNARIISRYTASQVKELYRRLAKMLHPDISPLCRQYPMLNELFNRVIVAYKCNDLKELQKLEVLVNKELEKNGVDNFSMVIPDIDERISELEQDIDKIVTSEPYIYKKLLNDVDAVEKKKDAINKEINEYTSYKCELNEKLIVLKEENING